ncbi:FAD binding domain-containing protein [Halorussus gelatinilyticus]|uniref:FAD binding domain-containing protein n=1 Tax=Halorussus gelatinilyticus TaxID=2937524 RepID=A0A8U0IH23_9EURY|nr:FAD binding domain-containing protein [Halorussus gelatinilyticus]UPW00367.1 FAD binding domain-containing protein [Halorussus gelatinilyticus]
MIPPAFDYHRASSVGDALDRLETHADDDPVVLAGGHGLLPDAKTGAASFGVAIDIGEIDRLRGVEDGTGERERADDDGSTAVGALTTHATLAESAAVRRAAPALTEAAAEVGDVQVRNRGTVGGNLVEADPAADLPAAAVAADATLVLEGRDGEREVSAEAFFQEDGGTDLGDRELLTEIRLPDAEADATEAGGTAEATGGAYAKKTHPATGYALVGVAASLSLADGTVTDARLAATGVADAPVGLTAVEDALVGREPDADALAEAAERAGAGLDPEDARSDVAASGEFRLHLLEVYAERALADAAASAAEREGVDR